MKKLIGAFFIIILAWSCSTDREDLPNKELLVANVSTIIDGCTVHTYDLGEIANVEIRNFYDHLRIRVSAIGDATLNQINYHFAENEEDFPTNKKGKFLFGQMDYKNKYPQGTYYEEFNIPLSELPEEFAVIVYTESGTGKNKESSWAGDLSLEGADWSYFEYVVEAFPFYAGTDQMREITLSEARAMPSWDEVRKLYANMLDEGVARNGTYNPSIWDIINDFNDPDRESQLGDYTTTYTLGTGECSDSVELTLRIIAD